MLKVFNNKQIKSLKPLFISLSLFLITGVFTGFIGATMFSVIIFTLKKFNYKLEFFLTSFLLTYFLANNFSGPLAYNGNLRFSILALTLIIVYQTKIKKLNLAWYTLPFVTISLIITLLFSTLGYDAILRSIAYFFVAYAIFKLINILYIKHSNVSIILFLLLFGFILLNSALLINPNYYLSGRFMGLTGNPNGLGMLLVFIFAIIDLLKQRGELKGFSKKTHLTNTIIIILLILASGSRTALASLVFYLVANNIVTNKKLIIPYSILSIIGVTIIYTINIQDVLSLIGSNIELRLDTLETASGRTIVWKVAWIEIYENLWYGQGFMYDNFFIKDYADKYIGMNRERHWAGIWSSYLSLLLNVGLVGLIAFAWMLFKFYQKAKLKPTAVIYIITILLIGITESWMAASMNPFTPLLFLYFAIQNQPLKKTINYK
ncbi:O-antigen ligase family protein [Tamlana sp. 2_MG-2023]|uniref:O-antigen ligase family protein n=1 Tax=unclassified Tamlana TaxID=2614803 RepID=UPI0026E1C91D|nr:MULTISPECIES: O-antigen ligase family protein [unclassified Tamlana]MDO6760251.1 O-antigen ligase family protein [Tamlana sp. 2_MG-2023]MDO6790051.1 O-antigen ligase family protein [Tamlana sp. 1_MG-2023]